MSLHLTINLRKGILKNTDFGSDNIFYTLGANVWKDYLFAQFGYTEKAFGANSFVYTEIP